MSTPKFGVLKEVDIRELWKHEQYDFRHGLPKKEILDAINYSMM